MLKKRTIMYKQPVLALLTLLSAVNLASSFPDSGKWVYKNISITEQYIGMVNTVYANTTMSIHLKCHEDYQVEFGWVLRKSPCWEEYNIYSRPYQSYFAHPDEKGLNYEGLGDNYQVHFVKSQAQTFKCGERVIIPPYNDDDPVPSVAAAVGDAKPLSLAGKRRRRDASAVSVAAILAYLHSCPRPKQPGNAQKQ